MNGVGAHEVLVETPEHDKRFADLTEADIERRARGLSRAHASICKRDSRFKYVMIFKNHGSTAGASLEHPHSQLIALPMVPKIVSEEMKGARDYYRFKERCVFCDIVRAGARSERTRLVYENADVRGVRALCAQVSVRDLGAAAHAPLGASRTRPNERVRASGQCAAGWRCAS